MQPEEPLTSKNLPTIEGIWEAYLELLENPEYRITTEDLTHLANVDPFSLQLPLDFIRDTPQDALKHIRQVVEQLEEPQKTRCLVLLPVAAKMLLASRYLQIAKEEIKRFDWRSVDSSSNILEEIEHRLAANPIERLRANDFKTRMTTSHTQSNSRVGRIQTMKSLRLQFDKQLTQVVFELSQRHEISMGQIVHSALSLYKQVSDLDSRPRPDSKDMPIAQWNRFSDQIQAMARQWDVQVKPKSSGTGA